MRNLLKYMVVGSLLLFGTTACADLEVLNQNDPDAARSLSRGGDVISLISGSYNTWFTGSYSYDGAGMALSNAAFQHNAPWANAGMEKYGRLPRVAFVNAVTDADYSHMVWPYFYSYRAIAAVADGLKALDNPAIQEDLTADEVASARAFGKLVQGLGHASVAVLYSEGFVVDETTDLGQAQEPLPYGELMNVALGYFDEAISLSIGASWTLPEGWMKAALTGPELARVAHSMKARFRSMNARSWAERQAVNWDAVIADIDAGITSDFTIYMDWNTGWYRESLDYSADFGWSQMAYFIYGMADQSGNYQLWNGASLANKGYNVGGKDILIVTPDLRFPTGSTIEEQRASWTPTRHFRINRAGSETGSTWARPDRGTWRWSWYKHNAATNYGLGLEFNQAEIRLEEMRLLKAEALYQKNDRAGAAALINQTRVAAGLNATDADGANTSCVPKLPDGTCGGLFEMLKWEKRMENAFMGPFGVGWYFDSRGWGDLWKDTFLHLPIPCAEAQTLQLLPCGSFGGPGGEGGAPLSNYKWNGEG